MAAKSFTITVEAFNYKFPPKPYDKYLHCDTAVPIGVSWVSAFNQCQELERKRLFLIRYNLDIIGTSDINSMEDYFDFIAADCGCCPVPDFCETLIDGCYALIDGCTFQI